MKKGPGAYRSHRQTSEKKIMIKAIRDEENDEVGGNDQVKMICVCVCHVGRWPSEMEFAEHVIPLVMKNEVTNNISKGKKAEDTFS
jgi:hypothetical protein